MGAKLRDLVGSKFGNLTVISFDHLTNGQSFWLCKCDCGNEKIISRNHLITGNTKTCGCQHYLVDDLSGKRFGRLTVIGLDHMNWNSISHWLCKCDCGNEVVVARHNLLRGTTKSCGCYASEMSRDRLTKHGMTGQRLYTIWRSMRQRCVDENNSHYDRYGGRGVNVCHEWDDFETSMIGPCIMGMDLDLLLTAKITMEIIVLKIVGGLLRWHRPTIEVVIEGLHIMDIQRLYLNGHEY